MRCFRVVHCALLLFIASIAVRLPAEPVPVRHRQGTAHGFLVVKTMEGMRIATGDITQVVQGDRVTSHLVFRFRDGSIDEDTTVFSQRRFFRLISDHHVQKGPSFPNPLDMLVDAVTGQITMRSGDGKITQEHLDLPDDVSNGMPPNLLLNVLPSDLETKLSFVAPTTKPRLVHLVIKRGTDMPFTIGGTHRKALDFVVHVDIGGIAGVVAPMVGKEPSDYHIWILGGAVPAFIREEGQLYQGGPVWRVEQASPVFEQ